MLESGTSKQPKGLDGIVKTMSNARRLKDYALVGKKLTQQRVILFSAAIALARELDSEMTEEEKERMQKSGMGVGTSAVL